MMSFATRRTWHVYPFMETVDAYGWGLRILPWIHVCTPAYVVCKQIGHHVYVRLFSLIVSAFPHTHTYIHAHNPSSTSRMIVCQRHGRIESNNGKRQCTAHS